MNATICGLIVLLLGCQPMFAFDSTPTQDSKLEVLNHYAGQWKSVFEIELTTNDDAPKRFSGDVEGKWIVGDKFLDQTGRYKLGDDSSTLVIKTIMSYDAKQNRYRYDYYISSGEINQSFGEWDESKKTMTSTMKNENDDVTTIIADFSTKDVERWTIETKDRDGKVTLKISGTNTRNK